MGMTSSLCTECGNSERYKSGGCKVCSKRAATAKYQAKNPDKCKAANAAWYQNNREKILTRNKTWNSLNKDQMGEYHAAWKRANLDKLCVYEHNRRARILEAGGNLSHGLTEKLFTLQRGMCACGCKQPLGKDFHRDHRMPLALGGTNTDDNIQLLRATCNQQKHAKHPVDFMQSRGFLL